MLKSKLALSLQVALGVGISSFVMPQALAAGDEEAKDIEVIAITGSRIRQPGAVSASPITSIGEKELRFQQEPEVEQILRTLPSTIPGDGSNVNNGSGGAAT
ncbi:hypothetical protein [Pseudoalteromonas sp. CO325X]|nr:hypothetical protein [Pseudoalteromonas sp. CO325X]